MTPCDPARPPGAADRPSVADGPELEDIYLGLTQITLGTGTHTTRSDVLGLDLDDRCTKVPDCPESESSGSCRPRTERLPADGHACRDNALASALSAANQITELGPRFGLSDDVINCGLRAGTFNVLVRIRGYNGMADDPEVRVDWYSARPHKEVATPMCDGANASAEPKWSPSTLWQVDASELKAALTATTELTDSRYSDGHAFVHDGVLVSRMSEDATLRLNASPYRPFKLPIAGAFWMGRLARMRGDVWHMTDGLIAGRVRPGELMRAVRQTGYCERDAGDLAYSFLVSFLDESTDLLAGGGSDASLACDALSYGIGFEAMQASPLGSAAFERPLECCPPGKSTDQCSSTCGDGKVSGDEKCDTAIESGQPGACPTACSPGADCAPRALSGTGCSVECKAQPVTAIGVRDGCCPADANSTTDPDCAVMCGNSVVETGETCDPPSSCTPCTSDNPCLSARGTGSSTTCNLRCDLVPITQCRNSDRCCPAGCNSTNDRDCSSMCGNRVIDAGETCENGTDKPCPSDCDDRNACTSDRTTGSAQNCNLTCSHERITSPTNGDGCCPMDATANVDSDCMPRCGNKVVEQGEECDDGNDSAGDSCFECRNESATQICLMELGQSDACAQCKCNKCTSAALACYRHADPNEANLCRELAACSLKTGCGNPDCFCGSYSLFSCLGGLADGPCKTETASAAKSSDLLTIDMRKQDTNYPLGRASAFRDCTKQYCATECGL
ncbi:MAG TPA: DUF4215 domain-containing protein [Polyangiales bacterium]|nr:DUF4215 domain-containing protein [Polyangiales bacterium]